MRTVQLKVPTIKCEGCVEKTRETLTRRRGPFGFQPDVFEKPPGTWPGGRR